MLPMSGLPPAMQPQLSAEAVEMEYAPPTDYMYGPPPPYSWTAIPNNQQYLGQMSSQCTLSPGQGSEAVCVRNPEEDYTIHNSALMYQPEYFVSPAPPQVT